MTPFWYAGDKEYDAMCQSFQEAIRAVGKQQVDSKEWNSNLDGKIAQMLLCDQISRNCFRRQDEAFAYDPVARNIARELGQELGQTCKDIKPSEPLKIPSLEGEMYPPYLQFTVMPLMHSEEPKDHDLALNIVDLSLEKVPPHLKGNFEQLKNFELQHKEVIDRFGRYPHRNQKMGRESTKEESEWLASDDVPMWAKSQ